MVDTYEPVIGIDLGTTYSCVGLYKPDGSVGILTDPYSGSVTIPSVITFITQDKAMVGKAAYDAAHELKKTLIYDVKRMIGVFK